MNTSMKSLMTFAAAMLVASAVHAHDCSGGPSGGMDATGNDCGSVGEVAPGGDKPVTVAAHGSTVAAASNAAHSNPAVAMNGAGHAPHHAHVRHASGAKSRSQG